jgi:hypothetical protein
MSPHPNDLAHALLIGQGRSGTNYLLGLLDQSPATHCRNEPDQLDSSALARLSDFRLFVDDEPRLAALFEAAVREAARCVGPRDHLTEVDKLWLKPGRRELGYFFVRQRMRLVERLLRWRKPMDGKELVFPRWMADHAALARAVHVFKLNGAVGYGGWALCNRPSTHVLHIVRHPGGFAKSWLKRWVRGEGGQQRGRGNADRWRDEDRLREIARRDARWAALFGDIARMPRFEGELWLWRWSNESLLEAGRGRPSYRRVLYEDLTREPVAETRAAYAFLGLEWGAPIEERVLALSRGGEKIARAWKTELEPDHVAIVERVLHGSPMESWWAGTEVARVSA